MSPGDDAAPLADTRRAQSVAVTTTDIPSMPRGTDDLAAARERRGARLALAHLRAHGLDGEISRRVLGLSA